MTSIWPFDELTLIGQGSCPDPCDAHIASPEDFDVDPTGRR